MRTFAISLALLSAALGAPDLAAQEPAPAAAPARAPAHVPAAAAVDALAAAKQQLEDGAVEAARTAVEQLIESDPDYLAAHDLLRDVVRRQRRSLTKEQIQELDAALAARYTAWVERFPDSHGVQFGLGALYSSREDPRARPYLLAAVQRDPGLAKAWLMLSIDAERWGNGEQAREYMQRAAAAEPDNPDYAFYAANNLLHVDKARWAAASREVARRFPDSERGAQALYWLGERAGSDAERIAVWEQARKDFPPQRFSWTVGSMYSLFDAYLRTDRQLAIGLARAMAAIADKDDVEDWQKKQALATDWLAVDELIAKDDWAAAAPIAERMTLERPSPNIGMLTLLQARVAAGNNDVQGAYDRLVAWMAQTPEDPVAAALTQYGRRLGKTAPQVDQDVWARRDADAKPAPLCELGRYGGDGKVTLADYRGKVVLLTFWFPGCGPCRGEFPYFEEVLARFRGRDVAYVGINVEPEQDDYVLPFMAGTKFTFTPLRGDESASAAFGVRGCPTNFLIDQAGRIVYRGFRTEADNELILQRMIESLLDHAPPK